MTPDERISVLEGLLEKVRQTARDRGLTLSADLPSRRGAGAPTPVAQPAVAQPAFVQAAPESAAADAPEPASVPPLVEPSRNGASSAKPKLLSFEDAPSEDRTSVSMVPAHIAVAAAAAASGGLVRFDGAFHEEETSVGDPDQIEAMALAEAHAAEQQRDGVDEAPEADGPATLPPVASARAPEPPVLVRPSGRPSVPLALEDLDEEYGDSVAPPPRTTDAPARVETPSRAQPAFVAPPSRVEPPAFVAPPSRVEPPAFVAPAFVEPPRISANVFADASPYAEAARVEPPMTTRSEQATRTPSLPEPAFVAAASDAEPASTGYVDAAELDVIELDEAELIQSTPPEPSMSDRAPTPAPEPSEPGNMFDRPTRLSDPTSLYADAELVEEEAFDPETLPPARDLAPLASGEPTYDLGRDEAPASERKPRDAARPLDDALPGIGDDEEPPESGEVESQRYPTIARESARAPLSDSPDAPTPIPPPPDDTAEVRALGSVDVVDRPAIVSAQPVYVVAERQRATRTFGDLLDDALSLGS